MKCKFCNAEVEAGSTKCPGCGAEIQPAGKLSAGKIALLAVLVVAAVGVVMALVLGGLNTAEPEQTATVPVESGEAVAGTIPADGNPDDVTCKGSYTAEDDKLKKELDTVVATVGNGKLTNGDLQIYYWMQIYDMVDNYSSYLAMFGLDLAQGLDTQLSIDGATTWQQYFLSSGLTNWHSYEALSQAAQEAGYVLEDEYRDYLDAIPASMSSSAATAGFDSADAMLQADMGAGATLQSYMKFMERYYLGYMYYSSQLENIVVTDEEVSDYFQEHAEEYESNGLTRDTKFVDVRHILLMPEGGTTNEDGSVSYSEEEWEACRVAAQAVLDEYLAGDLTEERFAELAGVYSVDGGSNTKGGLYTDVYVGQMVKPFEEWCFDPLRSHGETGLVQTTYGYHVMFFVQSKDAWYETAWNDLIADRGEQLVNDAMAAYPMEVDYSAIVLGTVDFTSEQ